MNHVGLLLFSPPFESFSIEMKRMGVVVFGWEGATSHGKALPRDLCFQEDLHFLITCDELTEGLAARPSVALGYHSFVLELASLIVNPLWVIGLFPLVCSISTLHLHWRVCEYCDLFYFILIYLFDIQKLCFHVRLTSHSLNHTLWDTRHPANWLLNNCSFKAPQSI